MSRQLPNQRRALSYRESHLTGPVNRDESRIHTLGLPSSRKPIVTTACGFAAVPSSSAGSALFTLGGQREFVDFGEHCRDPSLLYAPQRTGSGGVERASRRRISVAVALGLGLALAGCGSADGTAEPAAPQGADPVAWMGVFCQGLGQVIEAASAAPTPASTSQGEKDALLTLADTTQQAFATTAQKLTQLGQPGITAGKQAQDNAVGFFTTAANAVADRRAKLAALDPHDPNFEQKKADQLAGPDLGSQVQGLMSTNGLASAFGKAPQCQQLGATAGHR
jgi:hypothetical protein